MWRLGSILALLRMAVTVRVWRPGRYLHWRYETVFGRGLPESRRTLWHTAMEFGRWVRMMRRLR